MKPEPRNYQGVRHVQCPPEFRAMARADGTVKEHRLAMARKLGRPLLPSEVVHHIDHNPANNTPENLMLFASNREHKEFEGMDLFFRSAEVPGQPQKPQGKPSAFDLVNRRVLWHLAPPSRRIQEPEDGDEEPAVALAGMDPTELPAVNDDDDLDRVLRDYLGVKLPNTRCCQNHSTPWAAVHDAFFARSSVAVWKASRGFGGKSFTLSALSMAELLFLRADVNILGGSGEQSKRVLASIGKLWAHPDFPRWCMKTEEPGAQRQKTTWGNEIVALMASQASVRGPHPQRLRMDEVDEMKLAILDSALGQPMSKGWLLSQVVLSSTHQYPDGTMTQMLKRAGEQNWSLFEWCYRENLEPHGWLSMAEVERKRGILTVAMWNTEVELQEPSSEGRAFDTEKVEEAFQLSLGDQARRGRKDQWIIEDPVPGGRYGTGGDWAKKKNYTCIVTIRHDVVPARVVCITWTQKRPWPDMVADLDLQATMYPGTVVHDNTGLGQVVHDLIGVQAEPFDMVGQQRAALLSEYIGAVEHGDLAWPRNDAMPGLQAAYSEHKYADRRDIYKGTKDGTGTFHLPDTISAAAFAWRACSKTQAASGVKQPDGKDHPHLQRGVTRGRMSDYIRRGGVTAEYEEDDEDE